MSTHEWPEAHRGWPAPNSYHIKTISTCNGTSTPRAGQPRTRAGRPPAAPGSGLCRMLIVLGKLYLADTVPVIAKTFDKRQTHNNEERETWEGKQLAYNLESCSVWSIAKVDQHSFENENVIQYNISYEVSLIVYSLYVHLKPTHPPTPSTNLIPLTCDLASY